MTEEYRDINNFPNYQVSNFGNVRNKIRGNIIKPIINIKNKKTGYKCLQVNISNTEGIQRHKSIHKLVADAFLENPENKEMVDHIDGITSNNNFSNLRWATRSENMLNKNNKIRTDNTSGERNIYFVTQKNKWTFNHCIEGKQISCGFYNTMEEAKAAKETGNYNLIKTNTSEKNISFISSKQKYVFEKTLNGTKYRKSFKTIEEAIAAREEYLKN